MKIARTALALVLILTTTPLPAATRWRFFFEELEVARLIRDLSAKHRPADAAFIGVNVIPMTGNKILRNQTVLVRDGRIAAIGANVRVPKDVRRIVARGKFLIPGLTDAHVHTLETDADWLLHITSGITTIREMDGFPSLLEVREATRANRLFAPTSYVSGHILNAAPMGMYATVLRSLAEAERVVAEQKAAGYDYIKIHNTVPLKLFDTIIAAAKKHGLRVVGHVPQQVTVTQAISAGMWTMEHFKGYYHDGRLVITEDDWTTATKGADVWLVPTLVTRNIGLSAEETRKILERPEARYISSYWRSAWVDAAVRDDNTEQSGDDGSAVAKISAMSDEIFKRLLPVTDRWVAGTDSGGGYRNLIPGQILLDEVDNFERRGMKPYDALRSATVNAARALLDEKNFGTIEGGKRADLVLLDRNPLETTRNLREPAGVMLRGIWLDRPAMTKIREDLAAIYARAANDPSLDKPSPEQVTALRAGIEALRKDGWIWKDHQLKELAELK